MVTTSVLEQILAAKRANPYASEKTIEQLREEHRSGGAKVPLPNETNYCKVDVGGIHCEWVESINAKSNQVFLFLHGGGYYRGSSEATRPTAAKVSKASGMRCLSVNYRLAPEHPFPAAIEDVYNSYRWLVDQGINAKNIVVGGISAGGGLTLALLLKLKQRKEVLPAGAVPISAWTDLTQSGPSMKDLAANDPIISKEYLDRMASYYLGNTPAKTPLASPLFGDISGFPPLLIQVGTAETMMDDSKRLAKRAIAAGVYVEFEPWQDMFHGWHGSAHILEEAEQAIQSIGRFCHKVLPN